MSLVEGWEGILSALEIQRKKYGGTSIGDSVGLAVTGKGFRFPDDATARSIAANFEQSVESILDRRDLIEAVQDHLERTFSQDGASEKYLEVARSSVEALWQLNESALHYAERYIKKIELARKSKMQEEEAAEEDAARAARSIK
jgi:hypothetical protein